MIDVLNNDIILYLSFNLDLLSVLSFSQISKTIYPIFDNIFYYQYAIFMYSEDFWINAKNRPIFKSKPLRTYKDELIRIENFQRVLDRLNYKRWTQKDFYNYWKTD